MQHGLIDLSRAVPPIVEKLEASLADSLKGRLALQEAGGLLRKNRPQGTEEDRLRGAEWISQRLGFRPEIDRMIVTNGTLNVLFLLLNQLVGREGTLLTEEMTYPNMQALSGMLGFELQAIPMDRFGLEPNAFEDLCGRIKSRKVLYTIPTLQNPTASVMPLERRCEICAIAERHDVVIIEDDAQALMLDDGPPPMATLAPDRTWYVMGLAKTVVMGMRVAFLMAPRPVDVEALMARFGKMSMWFVAALQAELAQALIGTGIAAETTRAIRAKAFARRQIVADILERPELATGPLGLHVWIPVERDAAGISAEASKAGVLVRPGVQFAAHPGASAAMNGLRVSFCETREEGDLRKGLEILSPLLGASLFADRGVSLSVGRATTGSQSAVDGVINLTSGNEQ
ncbi:DNA-binding transcriptional MocR family regulator [Rhizobium sp. BK313]|uniref:aminotransferase-like domain-containing protein n=1 Tax=Rhizobium sp. BK313 TaxID=2587081 RepID=UPI0010620990|nr:PLP-dependent aminotransferase family protein [Rhizobium sp. BK313]MBB3458813.1 DNA-binding transcriptional MocR family regulator [Rhizobium sp. BK313]